MDEGKLRSAKKSARRVKIIDDILDVLKSDSIFRTIDYHTRSESYIKQFMFQPLLAGIERLYREFQPNISEVAITRKAKASVFWEGDVNMTVNHIRLLGVQHRPDFIIKFDELRIAVEIKRGESGSAVREGVGQSLMYAASSDFNFVVYLFVDISKDKKIWESLSQPRDKAFVESLWQNYNIRFDVV